MKRFGQCFLILLVITITGCQKEFEWTDSPLDSTLELRFKATVGTDPLVFGNTYSNAFSEIFSVKTFKFYIHGIHLINTVNGAGFRIAKDDHYLIDFTGSSANPISVHIPSGTYDQLSFIIGVDSIRNVSGAQTGALDPGHGMFWTWNTGYIMAKLEGNSPAAATQNNTVQFHVGGFRSGESVLRTVNFDFAPGHMIETSSGTKSRVSISADLNAWFNSIHPIRISINPVAMNPGPLAMQIADNYSNMFTVVDVVNE